MQNIFEESKRRSQVYEESQWHDAYSHQVKHEETKYHENIVCHDDIKIESHSGRCRSCCKSFISKFCGLFASENFWYLYMRGMIESFMGVMIVSMTEIKIFMTKGIADPLSLVLAVIMLISYFIFYCFVWSICFCEFIDRHENFIQINLRNALQKAENETKEEIKDSSQLYVDKENDLAKEFNTNEKNEKKPGNHLIL